MKVKLALGISVLITISNLGTAKAQSIYEDCLAAVENKKVSRIEELATTILASQETPFEKRTDAEICLEAAFKMNFAYDGTSSRWVSGDSANSLEELKQKRMKERQANIDKAKQNFEAKEAKLKRISLLLQKQECLQEKQDAISIYTNAMLGKIEGMNENLIEEKTELACRNLHSKNPDEAILNPICRKVFENTFHPDIDSSEIAEIAAVLDQLEHEKRLTFRTLLSITAELTQLSEDSKTEVYSSKTQDIKKVALESCD